MMRGKENYVVAVRKPNKEIVIEERAVPSWSRRYPILKWPLFRGVIAMAESVALAVRAISFSAKESVDEEVEITSKEMGISMVLGFSLAISLFFIFPVWLTRTVTAGISNSSGVSSWGETVGLNLIEGGIRLAVFFAYLFLVSRLKDIQRVFEYHGAEHKTIHAYEHGVELEPSKVSTFSTKHLRCGTSFLLIVMIVSIIVFIFLGRPPSIFTRIGLRLLVLPLVAGISYEIIKYAGRHEDSKLIGIIMGPGLFLQRLTTREPSTDQIEVAICSLKKVLLLEENKSGELVESKV